MMQNLNQLNMRNQTNGSRNSAGGLGVSNDNLTGGYQRNRNLTAGQSEFNALT